MFPTLCGSLLPRLTSVLYPQSNFKEIKSQALLSTCFVPGPQLGAWGKHHTIVSTAILGEGLINPILQRGKPKLREVPWLAQGHTARNCCLVLFNPLAGPTACPSQHTEGLGLSTCRDCLPFPGVSRHT